MPQPILKSLFDDDERRPMSVSQLNAEIRGTLERKFSSVWIEGEIINFSSAASGHWYFSLHDDTSQIKAACFRGTNYRIQFKPFDGLQVRVRGRVSAYEPKGEYQIVVDSLQPVGEGALVIAYEQIRARLEKEGLFAPDLKRPLPFLPRRVGVVTSPTGAAFHDIVNVLSRRTRSVSIVLIPSRVQGEFAAGEIRRGIGLANAFNRAAEESERIDVLIVGRGGGSREDLWAFNDEELARAIRDSAIPVISAVGHEIDWTIADFVADRRAPTPSAAAEIVAESESAIGETLNAYARSMFGSIRNAILERRNDLQMLDSDPVFRDFPERIREERRGIEAVEVSLRESLLDRIRSGSIRLESAASRLSPMRLARRTAEQKTRLAVLETRASAAIRKQVESRAKAVNVRSASLDALSPLKVLGRGYSITQNDAGAVIRSVDEVGDGDRVQIRIADGKLVTRVESREKN